MIYHKVFIPIKTVSEGNVREHWHKAASRHTAHRNAVTEALNQAGVPFPLTYRVLVTLVRHGVRKLDGDNLQFSFKWIRDAVADYLVPGLAKGRADDDPRLMWTYDQVKVSKGQEGFQILLQSHETVGISFSSLEWSHSDASTVCPFCKRSFDH